jgi:selenocysteine lyase/cysteine desulfurase
MTIRFPARRGEIDAYRPPIARHANRRGAECGSRLDGASFTLCPGARKCHGISFDRDIDVPRLAPAPDTSPEKFETGTQNHEGIVGAAAAVDFLASLSASHRSESRRQALVSTFSTLHQRGEAMLATLWNGLAEVPGLTLYGPKPGTPRSPTLSFTLKGHRTDDIATALASRGVFVSNGDFYASTVVERLGLVSDGLVRVGCSCYTTDDEVARLLDGVRALTAT